MSQVGTILYRIEIFPSEELKAAVNTQYSITLINKVTKQYILWTFAESSHRQLCVKFGLHDIITCDNRGRPNFGFGFGFGTECG